MKESAASPAMRPASMDNSEQFDLEGPGGMMRISVAHPFPPQPNLSLMDQRKTPVPVFVTDGNFQFGLAVSVARMMQFGGHVPPCLIVGIGYPEADIATIGRRRTLDLTPTPWRSPTAQEDTATGGGPAMLAFLRDELRQCLAQRYEFDDSNGVLCGLSLGGLFSLHAYATMPDVFPHHVALSPSLHWENGVVIHKIEQSLSNHPLRRGRLYVAAGAQEMEISPPTEPHMAREVQMVQRVVTVGNLLAELGPSIGARAEIIAGEAHHTIMATGLVRGLRYTLGDRCCD